MKIIICCMLLLSSWVMAATPEEMISDFDLKTYHPDQKGLKDFSVDIEIPSVTQQLNDQLIFGKLSQVIFRTYWKFPEDVGVDVIGLPEGFIEIKQDLKMMAASHLAMIIPPKFSERFREYTLVAGTEKNVVMARDKTGAQAISEYRILFSPQGLLQSIRVMKPVGEEITEYNFSRKEWSDNKVVVDSTEATLKEEGQLLVTKNKLKYDKVAGIGLPSLLESSSVQTIQVNDPKKEKKISPREVKTTVVFKNYKVNVGEAEKWFRLQEANKKGQ